MVDQEKFGMGGGGGGGGGVVVVSLSYQNGREVHVYL